MNHKIVSLDLETTGLDVERHEVWEVGIVPLDVSKPTLHYQLTCECLGDADPEALRIGRFYERYTYPPLVFSGQNAFHYAHDMANPSVIGEDDDQQALEYTIEHAYSAARTISEALDGATLLGAAVHFDERFLGAWLRQHGFTPSWSHRVLDLGSFCAGAWGSVKPLSTKAISDRIPNEAVHTALGDAQWNMDVYRSIVGSQVL